MSKFTPKQVTLDLDEYQAIMSELIQLKTPADANALTEIELQEATGILLVRSIQNPELFRSAGMQLPSIELGKYKAIFAVTSPDTQNVQGRLLVKFIRT